MNEQTRAALESQLAYVFGEPELLRRALTHPSYRHEQPDMNADNQRLEFLGDAVLSLLAAHLLFSGDETFREGSMTHLRSILIRAETLADLARQLGLGAHLLLGRGEELSGGRERDTNLCDALEAIVGALYLDGGWPAAQAFGKRFLAPLLTQLLIEGVAGANPKGTLQEYIQRIWRLSPIYRVETESGPPHQRHFVVSVYLEDHILARGAGPSKRQAESAAAAAALADPAWRETAVASRHPL